ncbi:hypothetical protein [Cypionkella sp.]|uniref:hypothetical protein n=1 Tax=Cypionkella sp. TaxID=2811411 RepID=UPI0027168640|nr:hypothetical protein [Cypionkella sp.]MDO8985849.1 hypothetical protein [Cypionkella sp.]MDP2051263.1 hypothetical protein [Cypionkella sp.]
MGLDLGHPQTQRKSFIIFNAKVVYARRNDADAPKINVKTVDNRGNGVGPAGQRRINSVVRCQKKALKLDFQLRHGPDGIVESTGLQSIHLFHDNQGCQL